MAEVVSAISGVASVVGALSGRKEKRRELPPPPEPEKAEVLPAPDDEAAKKASRRKLMELQQRSGRQSTDLTGNSVATTLGGSGYRK